MNYWYLIRQETHTEKKCYSLQEKKVFNVFYFCSSLAPSTRAWPWTGEIQGLCPASTLRSIWPRQPPKLVPALSILKLCGLRPTRYEMFKLFLLILKLIENIAMGTLFCTDKTFNFNCVYIKRIRGKGKFVI